jgi:hypothetical protein
VAKASRSTKKRTSPKPSRRRARRST